MLCTHPSGLPGALWPEAPREMQPCSTCCISSMSCIAAAEAWWKRTKEPRATMPRRGCPGCMNEQTSRVPFSEALEMGIDQPWDAAAQEAARKGAPVARRSVAVSFYCL
jgi:hypothetical protein